MKVEKMLMLIMMTCSLLIVSMTPVGAADETRTISDAEDDVIDAITGETYDYQNIDITELKYEREGINVTLTITVKGEIENLGDLEDPTTLEDIVTYVLILITSFDMYYIMYVNNYCVLQTSYDQENITDFSVDGSVLKINFNINNTDETYDSLTGDSAYMSVDLTGEDYIMIADTAGDLPLTVDALVTNLGETGKEIEFIGYAEYGQFPHIYQWNFGDGTTSIEKSPTHIYDEPGVYECIFTVTDDSGASESYTGEIEIVGDDDNGTPGFELIIAITAIGLIFLWKRKH